MPINRNKQGTARCILTHFLPVGIPRLEYPPASPSAIQIEKLNTKEDREPDLNISYLRRRGEYNFSSRLATRDAIPADEKTSFSNNLASSCVEIAGGIYFSLSRPRSRQNGAPY
ncbi:hypothetical protein ALC57_05995 [Trachymyrmex cornetzi]|uniref:Uncharacterized protein n=1 Tax=Trachymyrmex cornetzi TaxID=471704 RepID=A0A151J9P7_9HYME|nr:hypothetical protein ALC57_05995 [Trachymyrmex cornetzi]